MAADPTSDRRGGRRAPRRLTRRRSTPTSAAAWSRREPGPGPSRARRYPRGGRWRRLPRPPRARPRPRAGRPRRAALGPAGPRLGAHADPGRPPLLPRPRRRGARPARAAFEQVAALLWTGDERDAPPRSSPATARPTAEPQAPEVPIATRLCAHLRGRGRPHARDPGVAAGGDAARGGPARWRACSPPPGRAADGPLAERLARGWGARTPATTCAPRSCCAPTTSSTSARSPPAAWPRRTPASSTCCWRPSARCAAGATAACSSAWRTCSTEADRDGARAAADRAMGDGGELPGFGHPLYPEGDPRGAELLARAGPAGRGRSSW